MDQLRDTIVFGEGERRNLEALLPMAIAEDLDQVGDITTTATIPGRGPGRRAVLVARSPGVLAGLPVVERLADEFELLADWRAFRADGDRLEPGTVVARLAGPMRSLLTMERIALNFLQRLSGDRHPDRPVRRGDRGHARRDLRHPQDDAGLAGPGEVRRAMRRRAGITASGCTTPS